MRLIPLSAAILLLGVGTAIAGGGAPVPENLKAGLLQAGQAQFSMRKNAPPFGS